MNFKNIDRWSFRYAILRAYVRFLHNCIFYRKVCVTGRENIPDKEPIFFAPNHQNALMDALILLCNIKQQPVFIARADIFKNRVIARILISFKILPAYRIRDGKENLKKNEEIFDVSVRILENKNILTLFPETTHTNLKRLQELKKGVQRIVFQAEEKNGYGLGVKIIPVGIYYSNYWNIESDVQVNFGKPIEIGNYLEIYKENAQKAMLALRDRITEELKPLMINIENEEYYQLFEDMRILFNNRMLQKLKLKKCQKNKFIADQKIIEVLDKCYIENPGSFSELNNLSNCYKDLLNKYKLRHWVIEKKENLPILFFKSIFLIISSPLFLYGYLNNLIPYYLPLPITGKLKDRQFTTSINFVVSMIAFPVIYIIQTVLVWAFTETWWIKFAYLISLPVTGILAFKIHRLFIKLKSQLKFLFIRNKNDGKSIIELKNKMESIIYQLLF